MSSRTEAGSRDPRGCGSRRRRTLWVATLPAIVLAPLALPLPALAPPAERVVAGGEVGAEPCRTPVGWRIAELDERFGLGPEEARRAVEAAVELWSRAAGRALFEHAPPGGVPIRFRWDAAHDRVQERLSATEELQLESTRVQEAQEELDRFFEVIDESHRRHQEEVRIWNRRHVALNREIESWNRQGGIPESERARIDAERNALDRELESLNARVSRINQESRAAEEDLVTLNRERERLTRERSRIAREFPAESIRSGEYRETRRSFGPIVLSRKQEVFVRQFDHQAHLIRVLAHELGHALGLEHTSEPGSVMYVFSAGGSGESGPAALHPADIRALRDLCGP